MPTVSKKLMIAAAREKFEYEGLLEIDDGAKVSRAKGNPDKGAYVQAWVWITDEEAKEHAAEQEEKKRNESKTG